jgi:hypothetical protein
VRQPKIWLEFDPANQVRTERNQGTLEADPTLLAPCTGDEPGMTRTQVVGYVSDEVKKQLAEIKAVPGDSRLSESRQRASEL